MQHARRPVSVTLACGVVLAAQAGHALEAQRTDSPPSRPAAKSVPARPVLWKSQTSGNEYRVTIEGTTFHADRVNLPKDPTHEGAYVRTTARRQGSKWTGKTEIFLPCALGHGPVINKCHLTMGFEITEMASALIRGRIENPDLSQFDCKSCNAPRRAWKDFVWVPKGK